MASVEYCLISSLHRLRSSVLLLRISMGMPYWEVTAHEQGGPPCPRVRKQLREACSMHGCRLVMQQSF